LRADVAENNALMMNDREYKAMGAYTQGGASAASSDWAALAVAKALRRNLGSATFCSYCFFLVAAVLACSCPVLANDAGNLKGLSVDVKWSTVTTYRRDGDTRTTTGENRGLKLYVGNGGHVFEYGGFGDFFEKKVMDFGGAGEFLGTESKEMVAVTALNGKLTRIIKLMHGFWIQTIDITSSHDRCSYSETYKPDSDGKVVGYDPYTKTPYELVSRKIVSISCVVKEGNIFSSVQ
jgi:hypothetical protein